MPTPDSLADLYLDFVNNFLTVGGFAEHHGFRFVEASLLIDIGRDCHERRVLNGTAHMEG